MKKQTTQPEGFDAQKQYTIAEAADILPALSTSKFVGSVDIDIVLNLNDKQKKETIRGSVVMPYSYGTAKKVIVFAEEKDQALAKEAGADRVGLQDLLKDVEADKVEYDVVIATPTVMAQIARLGKVLGPKGLMPNPSNETVTADVAKAVKNYKSGKQDFKMSEQGTIRTKVAKLDMEPAKIAENMTAFVKAVYQEAKKTGGSPFKKITVSPTMGKAVKLNIAEVMSLVA